MISWYYFPCIQSLELSCPLNNVLKILVFEVYILLVFSQEKRSITKFATSSFFSVSYISDLIMFTTVFVSQILGIIENMSYFKCPNCSEPHYIFGKAGAQKTAADMGMKFLGEVWITYLIFGSCTTLCC